MGYRTQYTLTLWNASSLTIVSEEVEKKIIKDIESSFCVALDDENKWYDHIEEMTTFSINYPDIIFKFNNIGEEFGDFWSSCFYRGQQKVEYIPISFPDVTDLTYDWLKDKDVPK